MELRYDTKINTYERDIFLLLPPMLPLHNGTVNTSVFLLTSFFLMSCHPGDLGNLFLVSSVQNRFLFFLCNCFMNFRMMNKMGTQDKWQKLEKQGYPTVRFFYFYHRKFLLVAVDANGEWGKKKFKHFVNVILKSYITVSCFCYNFKIDSEMFLLLNLNEEWIIR